MISRYASEAALPRPVAVVLVTKGASLGGLRPVTRERDVPDHLSLDVGRRQGTFVRTPKLADVPYPVQMEPNLVIEFYSR